MFNVYIPYWCPCLLTNNNALSNQLTNGKPTSRLYASCSPQLVETQEA